MRILQWRKRAWQRRTLQSGRSHKVKSKTGVNGDIQSQGRVLREVRIGGEFTGIPCEPRSLAAAGSLTLREANLSWQITFFVAAKLFCCDDSTVPSETLFTESLRNRFSVLSLEGSGSVAEDTFEASPWICTWLLLPELQGIRGSQEIFLGRALGMQLCQ